MPVFDAGASAPPFTMTATMVVAKYPYYPPVEDGVDTVKVTDIEANSRVVQRFNGVNQNGKSSKQYLLVHLIWFWCLTFCFDRPNRQLHLCAWAGFM